MFGSLEVELLQRSPEQLFKITLECISLFNHGQEKVYSLGVRAVMPSVRNDRLEVEPVAQLFSDQLIFTDAPGGTGKAFLESAIQIFLKSMRKNVVAIPSSALAAKVHDDGQTAHSTFQTPISIGKDSTCKIPVASSIADDFKRADLIICNEIFVSHRYILEAVGRALCDITRCNLPFRGKAMLLIGNFRHILPAVRSGSRF